ncbi:MAG: endonuclease/exonuclease/phosphatase family protein [Bacteroidota bacterium]
MKAAARPTRRRRGLAWWNGLHLLLMAFFLMAYTTRYVHPRTLWWTELVGVTLPALMACVALGLLLTGLKRQRELAAAYLLLLLLGAWRLYDVQRLIPAAPASDDEVLRVMTYNAPAYPVVQPDSVRQAVARERPHLIGLQEPYVLSRPNKPGGVGLPGYLQPLIDSLGYALHRGDGRAHRITYQPVLGHVEVLASESIDLVTATRAFSEDGQLMRVRFRWQGREAVLYNVHLQSFQFTKPWDMPLGQFAQLDTWRTYVEQFRAAFLTRAEEARLVRARLEQETLPVLLVGDFNSTPHNWVYHHLAAGLQDAFRVRGIGWGATYRIDWPLVRIDFVLATPDWEVIRAYPVTGQRLSDHRPVMAHLRWRTPPP